MYRSLRSRQGGFWVSNVSLHSATIDATPAPNFWSISVRVAFAALVLGGIVQQRGDGLCLGTVRLDDQAGHR